MVLGLETIACDKPNEPRAPSSSIMQISLFTFSIYEEKAMHANVKDETRAGERADDLNSGKMRSGAGPYELRSIPARCLCRLVRLIHSFA